MRNLLIVTIFFSSILSVKAQEKLTDSQQVQQTINHVFEALSNRDSVALKKYCSADVLLFEYGQVWNLDTLIRKAIKRNTAKDFKRVNTIDFIKTKVNNNTAWAAYNLHSEIMREGKQATIHWLETVVLEREKKKWNLKVLHSTMIKRN